MSNAVQYVVGTFVIVAIALIDKFLIVELRDVDPPVGMVWIDGTEFVSESSAEFTDRDPSQDFQLAGFWIDGSSVGTTDYQRFLAETGYVSTFNSRQTSSTVHGKDLNQPNQESVFALRDETGHIDPQNDLRIIHKHDALAYCNWRGMTLSNKEQNLAANNGDYKVLAAPDITLHASQPMSDSGGFRCVKLVK